MIVSVINIKGGTGKTTTAIALASAAAADGREAIVYDADPQSSASLWSMTADQIGDPMPFAVESANIATVRKMGGYAGDPDRWAFVDCPPSGHVMDEAMRAADLVVVPTTPSPADMVKSYETVAVLDKADVPYAMLLTRVIPRTLTYKQSMIEIEDRGVNYFETAIPSREALKAFFGNAFGRDLYCYDKAYAEILECFGIEPNPKRDEEPSEADGEAATDDTDGEQKPVENENENEN